MAIKLQNTKDIKQFGVKCIVYGPSGTGKTTLCATAPNPVVGSVESGLLSVRKANLSYMELETLADLEEFYAWCTGSKEASKFQTICLDSVTDIAEIILANLKKKTKDPRQAYGEVQEKMLELLRAFRGIDDKHVYFSAKQERIKDDSTGSIYYGPMMPGTKLGQQLPYYFDEVFRSLIYEDAATKQTGYFLKTRKDSQYEAKDRSGVLDEYEEVNLEKGLGLTTIFNKILA